MSEVFCKNDGKRQKMVKIFAFSQAHRPDARHLTFSSSIGNVSLGKRAIVNIQVTHFIQPSQKNVVVKLPKHSHTVLDVTVVWILVIVSKLSPSCFANFCQNVSISTIKISNFRVDILISQYRTIQVLTTPVDIGRPSI